MTRISIDELRADQLRKPVLLLDVRSFESRARDGWIEGSIHVEDDTKLNAKSDDEIVVYCDCPNDASAALFSLLLRAAGFANIRPLSGGITAWRAWGFRNDATS